METGLALSGTEEADAYLFQSVSSVVEFTVIEEEMAQLNDFCAAFAKSIHHRVDELSTLLRNPVADALRDKSENQIPVAAEDIAFGADFELNSWRDSGEFLVPVNCLLLLFCFAEKSLGWLCARIGDGRKVKSQGRQSQIAAYLLFLSTECGLSFEEPPINRVVREYCRSLRNSFAHGDWDRCRMLVKGLSVPAAFASISKLLKLIEAAYVNRPPQRS